VPISLNEVVRAAVETSRPTAGKHTVELVESLDSELPDLMLDEVKMRQVVVNLLVNAIRFSPEHGTVKVVTRREPKFMIIEVVDQGPGILPEETVRIFELFGQGVRGLDRRMGGLGIGLHLVRRISELHGAHVGVNSQPGQGSTFWVRLPASLADEAERAASGQPVAELSAVTAGFPEAGQKAA
jgi:signal transduction histidine kinase